jgi:hypothetical protein
MAVNKSQNIHHENERSLSRQIPEIQTNEGTAGMVSTGGTPPYMAPALGEQGHSNLHSSFMQCPKCCNCSSGCSHYGNGHFDDNGTYVGPGK